MKYLSLFIFVLTTTIFVACGNSGGSGSKSNCNYGNNIATPGALNNNINGVNQVYGPTGVYGQPNAVNGVNPYRGNCNGINSANGLPNYYPRNSTANSTFQPQLSGCSVSLPIFPRDNPMAYCSWLANTGESVCDGTSVRATFMRDCAVYAIQMNYCTPVATSNDVYVSSRSYHDRSDDYISDDEPRHYDKLGVTYGGRWDNDSSATTTTVSAPARHDVSNAVAVTDTGRTPINTPAETAPVKQAAPAPAAKSKLNLNECIDVQKIHDQIRDLQSGMTSLAIKYIVTPIPASASAEDKKAIYDQVYNLPLLSTSNHNIPRTTAFGNDVYQNGSVLNIDDQQGTITGCNSHLNVMWVDFVDKNTKQLYHTKFELHWTPNKNFEEGFVSADIRSTAQGLKIGTTDFFTESYVYFSTTHNVSDVNAQSIDGKLYIRLRDNAKKTLGSAALNSDRKAEGTFEGIEKNTQNIVPGGVIMDTK